MKTVEIIGYKRANLGKSASKHLRNEGNAPCVLYGGKEQIHFYTPMYLFKELVYSPEVAFVKLNIEGDEYDAILQDIQFHPVNDTILHADFLQLFEDKPIKMEVPLKFVGNSPGMVKGGKLMQKLRKLSIKALPANFPEYITIDISDLDLGKSVKVGKIQTDNFEILNNEMVSIATVAIPRVLRSEAEEEEAEAEATTEAAEAPPEESKE